MFCSACAQVQIGHAQFHIFRQCCGIKIGICKAPMDTEARREGYAKLMLHANGTGEGRKSFNADHPFRWLVVEPYDNATGGGFFIDDEGLAHSKTIATLSDSLSDSLHEATALYNKPEADAEKHWIRISAEEARETLTVHDKAIPYHFIAVMQKMCQLVEHDAHTPAKQKRPENAGPPTE